MLRSRYCLCVLCVILAAALALVFSLITPLQVQARPDPVKTVSFINEIAPILKENCLGCHGAKNPKGKLNMTRFDAFRKGGTKDDPIVPGKPEESYLIDVLKGNSAPIMPPKDAGDPLRADKITLIERWIKEGANLDPGLVNNLDLPRELRNRWKSPQPAAIYPFPVMVNSLTFTPDGKKLVVGGHHELTIWDVESAKLEKRITTRCRRALAMVFLPDGKLVVAGGRPNEEGDVRVYDINGGTPHIENGVAYLDGVNDPKVMLKKLLDSDDEILALALSKDGKKLAAGGCDRIIHVWDISSGITNPSLFQTIENHADWVFGLAFHPDGNQLLTCSRDKTSKLWDFARKEALLTFPDHQNSVTGVTFKADGKWAFSVGEDNQLRTWNIVGDQGGKQVRATGGHNKAIFKLIPVPGQPLLATASADGTVRIWNGDNGSAVRTLTGHSDHVFALAVSSDGKLLASGAWNGEVRIWKLTDGSLIKSWIASPGIQMPVNPIKK